MKLYYWLATCFAFSLLALEACSKLQPAAPPDDALLDGPISGLLPQENRLFLEGDIAFNDEIFTSTSGLGPLFVATSCGSCHAGDGKGHPFSTLTRFGQRDSSGNTFLHLGGPQLQHRAIPGYLPEQIPQGASFARFTPPANTGLGFLELVSDADLLAHADPTDADNDGISGVPGYATLPWYIQAPADAIPYNGKYIHRFGKKAAAFNLLHQTVNAYNQDMGISSSFEPADTYTGQVTDPEVSNKTIQAVVFYLQTLKAPIQRNSTNENILAGKNIFIATGCESCHKQTMQTGYSPVAALSYKTFQPYTDLLLHDMGPQLNDGYTEGSATAAEWRTPPLWGLGLSPQSQGGQYFLMHDGRAPSIDAAIQLHGGEAAGSHTRYNQLSQTDKSLLIQFLESL